MKSRPSALLLVLAAAVVGLSVFVLTEREPAPTAGAEALEETPVRPDAPGVRHVEGDRYEVVLYAYDWGWDPSEIRVPAGAEVTFRASSRDNPHALYVEGTEVRLTAVRGQFREASHTFDEPGVYSFACDEYCGGGHDTMTGRIVVE